MTFQGDPYRTLGISSGASLNEIRSAYRRLAKQWHPDAAGDRALPRFLAIQAAYERLVDGEGRLRPVPGASGSPGRRSGEAWRADQSRARASREAWRARRSGGGTAAASGRSGGAAQPAGSAPGGTRPAAGDGAADTGEAPPRERHTRRGFRKATPGSTTYDEAADAPLDPEWEGGSWYGQTSRTYWTINPREYADPRKHGPEYQARARRAARLEDDAEGAEGSARASAGGIETESPEAPSAGPNPTAGAETAEPSWGWSGSESTTTDGGEAGWGTHGWAYEEAGDSAPPRRRRRSRSRSEEAYGSAAEPLPDLEAVARRAAPTNLLALARRPGWHWRLLIALIAWPPVGYGIGTLLSTATGCAQFSASCPEPLPLLSLAVQPLVLAALFALPPAAAVGAFASIVAFAVAVPVATVLSVSPGPGGRVGTLLLGVAVTLAYLVAMVAGAIAVWRPRATASQPEPPA